jgi:orotidine-5'-phosphate decarboxylase
MEKLQAKWDEGKFVCVGLDSDLDHKKFPKEVPLHAWALRFAEKLSQPKLNQLSFNCWIVDQTQDLVCAYKPNLAFYNDDQGKVVLRATIEYIRGVAPDVVVILDAKQADIGNTNNGYVTEDFYFYDAHAVTVHPYLGAEAMKPFLDREDKGIIVLCRTSNPGAGEFQDQLVPSPDGNGLVPLYQLVAHNVSHHWDYNGNCAVVVGATYPSELTAVRHIVGDMPILIPGIGAQGCDLEATVRAGRNSVGQGMIINSSRGIIFASSGEDFAEAARSETQKLHEAITACLAAA